MRNTMKLPLGTPYDDEGENYCWNTCCAFWAVECQFLCCMMKREAHDQFLRESTCCPSSCRNPPLGHEDGEDCCGL